MIEIRKYDKQHSENQPLAEKLYQLSQKAFENGSPWSEKQFLEDIQQKNKEYYLGFDGRQIIAYVALQRLFEESELLNIAVDPRYQRMCIGKKILQTVLFNQAAEQVEKVFLEVRENNYFARNFYLKNGFEEIGRRENYYHHPTEDAVLMVTKIKERLTI